jgi:hypothetical protein
MDWLFSFMPGRTSEAERDAIPCTSERIEAVHWDEILEEQFARNIAFVGRESMDRFGIRLGVRNIGCSFAGATLR